MSGADGSRPSNYCGRQINLDTVIFEGENAPAIYVGDETKEENREDVGVFLWARIANTEGETSYTIYVPADAVEAYKTAYADYADHIVAAE